MGEIHRKWFTITWGVMLLFSVVMSHLMRHTDIAWVQHPGVVLLCEVVSWLTLVVTIMLFVWYNIRYWRENRRLFWRKWGGNLVIGIVIGVVLLLAINLMRGDKVELLGYERYIILGVFAVGGFVWMLARYKFKNR